MIVLPFENISSDPDQEYFSDGLTEEIITDLSHIPDLLVISRSSAMTFKGTKNTIREIAEKVNVKYVLEGSVRKAGNNLRITAQLIDAIKDTHLWAEKYSGTLDDIFEIQEKVSHSIAEALKIKLYSNERKHNPNVKSYDLYLLGCFYWNKRTEEGLQQSIEYFEQAIEEDKNFALAYVGLADVFHAAADWNYLKPEKAHKKALEYIEKAFSLEQNIAEAYAIMASIKTFLDRDHEKADLYFKIAISKNPNYAIAYLWYALHLTLMGRFDEAFHNTDQALKLDPLSAIIKVASGFVYYYSRSYDKAILIFLGPIGAYIGLYPNITCKPSQAGFWIIIILGISTGVTLTLIAQSIKKKELNHPEKSEAS